MKKKLMMLLALASLSLGTVAPVWATEANQEKPTEGEPPTQPNPDHQPDPQTPPTTEPTVTTQTPPSNPQDPTQDQTQESSEEKTKETTKEDKTTTVASQPQPNPRPTPRPNNPTPMPPSNLPTDYEVVTSQEDLFVPQEDVEMEEPIDLFEGDFITFNANIFGSEEEADEFIKMIEEDEATKDRFETQKEVVEEDFVLVHVTYTEDATEEGRYILFYVSAEFEDEVEAQAYLDQHLLIYPDLFVAGEVIKVEEKYDVVFGIRPGADTQALTYDEETFEIQYEADRKEYTYVIELDPTSGEFIDDIQAAVEAAFPGEFMFTQVPLSETEQEVTMTPVAKEEDSQADATTLEDTTTTEMTE